MLGWITIFALMFLVGLACMTGFLDSSSSVSLTVATVLSGALLAGCVLARVARGRL
jgi:hypothetical protein